MDKITHRVCPRCGSNRLSIYYEDDADLELAAQCEICGLKGYYMNSKLVQLATAQV